MTTRERFCKCMRFETVDRPPNFELGYWGHTIERWLSEGMPKEAVAGAHFYGHEFFGVDKREYLPINFDMIPLFQQEIIEETERVIVYRDVHGIVRRALKEGTVRGTRPSMDQYIDFPVKNRKDFQEVKKCFDPNDLRRYPADWEERVEKINESRSNPLCLVPNGCLGFYSLPRRWMGTENLSLIFYDDPAFAHEMMEFIGDFIIESASKALKSVKVDYFNFFEDLAHKTAPLISPDIFKEFILPHYKRVIAFLKSTGIDIIWFDSDGNIEVLIPMLIEAGVTCIWPLEAAADMEPKKLRRQYGKDLALSGGIDKRELTKDKKAIEQEVMSKIPELLADGGYIPTLDHTFPPDISYENFLYYLELKAQAVR